MATTDPTPPIRITGIFWALIALAAGLAAWGAGWEPRTAVMVGALAAVGGFASYLAVVVLALAVLIVGGRK